jgi:nucleoside-diphosphate-sugar epimerase
VQDSERVRPDKSEVELLLCNPAKARQLLGWQPQVSLDEGLARTVDFIRAHPEAYKAGGYTI